MGIGARTLKFDSLGITFSIMIFSLIFYVSSSILKNTADENSFDYYKKNIKNKKTKSTLKSPKFNKDTFKTYNKQLNR